MAQVTESTHGAEGTAQTEQDDQDPWLYQPLTFTPQGMVLLSRKDFPDDVDNDTTMEAFIHDLGSSIDDGILFINGTQILSAVYVAKGGTPVTSVIRHDRDDAADLDYLSLLRVLCWIDDTDAGDHDRLNELSAQRNQIFWDAADRADREKAAVRRLARKIEHKRALASPTKVQCRPCLRQLRDLAFEDAARAARPPPAHEGTAAAAALAVLEDAREPETKPSHGATVFMEVLALSNAELMERDRCWWHHHFGPSSSASS